MKATLKVLDRIALQTAMQRLSRAGYAKFVTARDVKKKVMLSQDELDEVEATDTPEGSMKWNPAKDGGKEFEFTDRETELIREVLETMDRNKQLEWGFIPVYELFCRTDKQTD